MQKLNTFWFLFLSLCAFAQTNNGIVKVNVEDGCGNKFSAPVVIDLYQNTNNTTVKIASSNVYPAEFKSLDSAASYQIRISSPEMKHSDPSIKDLIALREIILGLKPMTLPSRFASDVNGNGGMSTLDLVMLQRHMVQIEPLILGKWFFMDQKNINIIELPSEYVNNTSFMGIPNNLREITFNGYKHGATASTVQSYCGPCVEPLDSETGLIFPDVDVTPGKEVDFTLQWDARSNDKAISFSLKYLDGDVTSVSRLNSSVFNKKDSSSIINVNFIKDIFLNNTSNNIMDIKFVPKRAGKLISFFKINENFKNEAVYKEGECLKTYNKIKLGSNNTFCEILWPKDIVVNNCSDTVNTGSPVVTSSCKNNIAFSYADEIIGSPCETKRRTWKAVNAITNEIFSHTQIITIKSSFTCIYTLVVTAKDSVKLLAKEFLSSGNPNQIYSFSLTDPNKTSMVFYKSLQNNSMVTIFGLTEKTKCSSIIKFVDSSCSEPIKIKRTITLKRTGNNFIAQGYFFDDGNKNHCRGQITDFQIKLLSASSFNTSLTFNYDEYAGTSLDLVLRYKVEGSWEVSKSNVKVIFEKGVNKPPFELVMYDDAVTKNVPHEIAIFTNSKEKIYGFQGAFKLKDALYVRTKAVTLSDLKYNEDLRSLRFIWVSTGPSRTFSDKDSLFTITILPTQNGLVSDILSLADDLLNSEVVLNDLEGNKLAMTFKFLNRPSSTLNLKTENYQIYPNPSSTGQFTLIAPDLMQANIKVFDQKGQVLTTKSQLSDNGIFYFDLPEYAPNGIYFVKVNDGKSQFVHKLMLLR